MKKIHVDSTMGIHIILGSDDLSKKFSNLKSSKKRRTGANNIIFMPIPSFIEKLNIFLNFINEPHIKIVLDNYVDVGVLNNDKSKER